MSSLEKYAEEMLRNNMFDAEAVMKILWAGRLTLPPVCGERFKKGWFCSRDEGHDGPCAAYQMPTRWKRFRWWVAAHLPRIHIGPCNHSECY